MLRKRGGSVPVRPVNDQQNDEQPPASDGVYTPPLFKEDPRASVKQKKKKFDLMKSSRKLKSKGAARSKEALRLRSRISKSFKQVDVDGKGFIVQDDIFHMWRQQGCNTKMKIVEREIERKFHQMSGGQVRVDLAAFENYVLRSIRDAPKEREHRDKSAVNIQRIVRGKQHRVKAKTLAGDEDIGGLSVLRRAHDTNKNKTQEGRIIFTFLQNDFAGNGLSAFDLPSDSSESDSDGISAGDREDRRNQRRVNRRRSVEEQNAALAQMLLDEAEDEDCEQEKLLNDLLNETGAEYDGGVSQNSPKPTHHRERYDFPSSGGEEQQDEEDRRRRSAEKRKKRKEKRKARKKESRRKERVRECERTVGTDSGSSSSSSSSTSNSSSSSSSSSDFSGDGSGVVFREWGAVSPPKGEAKQDVTVSKGRLRLQEAQRKGVQGLDSKAQQQQQQRDGPPMAKAKAKAKAEVPDARSQAKEGPTAVGARMHLPETTGGIEKSGGSSGGGQAASTADEGGSGSGSGSGSGIGGFDLSDIGRYFDMGSTSGSDDDGSDDDEADFPTTMEVEDIDIDDFGDDLPTLEEILGIDADLAGFLLPDPSALPSLSPGPSPSGLQKNVSLPNPSDLPSVFSDTSSGPRTTAGWQ